MSSKRRLRRKACQGKIRHKTDGAAFYAASKTGDGCAHYRCEFCSGYHVGHPPSSVKGLRPGINDNRW